MSRFSDAALLKGKFAHKVAELRAGQRTAPKQKDWNGASCDNQAEETAQEVAKHIFSLQSSVDAEKEKLEILHFTAIGIMRVLALVPGEGDVLRLDGVLENGNPVAQAMHASQLSLTFVKAPLKKEEDEDDGLQIGFLIFDELTKRRKARDKRLRKLSLSTSQTIPAKKKSGSAKKAAK
jgi:hypothetical protein